MTLRSKIKIIKTASYAAMHLTLAVAVGYLLSGSWQLALSIGLLEPLVQTLAYHVHDAWWSRRERAAAIQGPGLD